MNRTLLIGVLLLCSCLPWLHAQQIHYDFRAPNAAHHEAEITLTVQQLPPAPAIFRMSRSSPGRYATHEFGKNVYHVTAKDENGEALPVIQTDGDVYQVTPRNGYVQLRYTLFANYADGTYAGIDPTGYHLNMPACFMWLKGYDSLPIHIHFDVPDPTWSIATQLPRDKVPNSFTAPGLQYFMDAPVKIGPLLYTTWQVTSTSQPPYRFRIALDGTDSLQVLQSFGEKVQQVVLQARSVFGETPAYDYGEYTFLASINPYVKSDGMEHRNSTMISIPAPFRGENWLLGVFAHEFFHCWNVERIRPQTIEPFNFEKSNRSDGLWLAEGFTQYYGELLLVRAGFTSPEAYCQTLSQLVNARQNTPGGLLYSPVDNSGRAVFTDAGVSVDKTNYPNMFTSYYFDGAAVALALDLEMRTRFQQTLDDYMRGLWKQFGKTEQPYTLQGLQNVLAATTGDTSFAAGFFRKYIYGSEPFEYAPLLAAAGMRLAQPGAAKAWIGNLLLKNNEQQQVVLAAPTVRNTPLYQAGLDAEDILISLDGKMIQQKETLDTLLAAHRPGDRLPLVYLHRNVQKQTTIQFQPNPAYTVQLAETAGSGNISPTCQAFRHLWLGKGYSRVKKI